MPFDSNSQWYNDAEAVPGGAVASAARTTTGTGTAFSTADYDSINGSVVVSAASGTNPTLDLTLETTADGTNYYTAGTWTQKTGTATADARVVDGLGTLSRWKWTIGGTTPSFTFAVTCTGDRDD